MPFAVTLFRGSPMIAPRTLLAPLALFLSLAAQPAGAVEDQRYQNLLAPIFAGGETTVGQAIAYPEGTPKVTAAIVTIPPGGATGWHSHDVPLFVYVLDGEVTVDYGEKGVKVYKAGDGLLEAMNWPHNGMNQSSLPVRILAVYMGAEGTANTEMAPQ
jgi:quercetin dioxygenase-like cupin family protein